MDAALTGTVLVPPPRSSRDPTQFVLPGASTTVPLDVLPPLPSSVTDAPEAVDPALAYEAGLLDGPMSVMPTRSGALLVADTEHDQILSCVDVPVEVPCNWPCYINRYPDLSSDVAAAQQHYIARGKSEGRDCTCAPAEGEEEKGPEMRLECTALAGGFGRGIGESQLMAPYGFAIANRTGQMFIADTLNHRIQRWEPGAEEGDPMHSPSTIINGSDASRPELNITHPVAVVLDEQRGLMYVADTANHRIQRFSVNSKGDVISGGQTVAGVSYVYGDALNLFDNPTALYVVHETMTLWVADARNRRIMRWEYGASEGVLEVGNLTGRPYGVTVFEGSVYFSDADECTVYKRLLTGGEKVAVAGGQRCGSAEYQLWFPAGVTVAHDGGVLVSDSNNDRIVRWPPDPSYEEYICTLAEPCNITLKDGNPSVRNLLVIIPLPSPPVEMGTTATTTTQLNEPPVNPCGGACSPSGFSGPSWSDLARPLPPLLRLADYAFGVAVGGKIGDYALCWGAIADEEQVLNNGDCSATPFHAGTLTMRAYVKIDETGEQNQCVRFAKCKLALQGYSLPNTTWLLVGTHEQAICGNVDGKETFQGYRNRVSMNPAELVNYTQPFKEEGDETVEVEFDLGVANGEDGAGRLPLCLCTRGIDCVYPAYFDYAAGFFRIRGALGGQRFICYEGRPCNVTIDGTYLSGSDVLFVASISDTCGKTLNHSAGLAFARQRPNASEVSVLDEKGSTELVFELGMSHRLGRFTICYCASYDGEHRFDNDELPCSTDFEFLQEAAILEVKRVQEFEYTCVTGQPCNATVEPLEGILLNKVKDKLLVEVGGREVCGKYVPIPYWARGGNTYDPHYSGNATHAFFIFNEFVSPGIRHLCYCADYTEEGLRERGPCDSKQEYYQVAGRLVVRGPRDLDIDCVAEAECNVAIVGTALTEVDRLQVYRGMVTCPGSEHGHENLTGLLTPGNPAPVPAGSEPGDMAVWFHLGILSKGPYTLCYCANFSGHDMDGVPCSTNSDLTLKAGLLKVRGTDLNARFSCVATDSCQFIVRGYELRETDHVLIAPIDGNCSSSDAISAEILHPSPVQQAVKVIKEGPAPARVYRFSLAAFPGRFRVCYCTWPSCSEPSAFHLDAGMLFIKGVVQKTNLYGCAHGTNCSHEVEGFGLRDQEDGVQLAHATFGCAGAQVVVVGGTGWSATMNGVYFKQPGFFDGRSWYQNRDGGYLFFDIYDQRWILGPELNPDCPEEEGWAWYPGRWAMTPDKFVELEMDTRAKGSWFTWDAMAIPAGARTGYRGAWVHGSSLQVRGSSAPEAVYGENPSMTTTDIVPDDVLGTPYLLKEQFQFGLTQTIGAYRLCLCLSTELADLDKNPCTSDDEYTYSVGILVIHAVRGKERYHCSWKELCLVRTPLDTETYGNGKPLAAMVLNNGTCHQAPSFPPSDLFGAGSHASGVITNGMAIFNLGEAKEIGTYAVCVCTNYDLGDMLGDGVPCNQPEEFFQHAGQLNVAVIDRMTVEGGEMKIVPLNLTRGSDLDFSDRLSLVSGDACPDVLDVSTRSWPLDETGPLFVQEEEQGSWSNTEDIDRGGGWAFYELSLNKPRGPYRACMCTGWDGLDEGDTPCDHASEFTMEVAAIIVSALDAWSVVSTVDVALQLQISPQQAGGAGLMDVAKDGVLATLLASALSAAVATVLGKASSAVEVVTLSVVPSAYTSRILTTGSATAASTQTSTVPPVRVRATFRVTLTATLTSQSQDCQINTAGKDRNATDTQTLLRCLALSRVFADPQLIEELTLRLNSTTAFLDIPSAIAGKPLQFEPPTDARIEDQLPEFDCIRGVPCNISVNGNTALSTDDGLLMLDGAGQICGPTFPWPMNALAASRGAAGFLRNPVSGNTFGNAAQQNDFLLQGPSRAGTFTLCYCWSAGAHLASQTGSQAGGCSLNNEFYQIAGTLRVHGPPGGSTFICLANVPCKITIEGLRLTAWDRAHVVNSDASCGSSNASLTMGIGRNPTSAMVGTMEEGGMSSFDFDLGISTAVGVFKLCYCVANLGGLEGVRLSECESMQDFSMEVGIIAIRGPSEKNNHYVCVKSDQELIYPCTHTLQGAGFWPGVDSMLVTELDAPTCYREDMVFARTVGPNPAPLEAADEVSLWPAAGGSIAGQRSSSLRLRWDIASQQSSYRVCFCPGGCAEYEGNAYPVGILTVRGATGLTLFMCEDGRTCDVVIDGLGLRETDHVAITGPAERCGWAQQEATLDVVKKNPIPALSVSANGSSAVFQLGELTPNPRGLSMSFRLCYCASYTGRDGRACSNMSDFTHSAGFLNTLICEEPPQSSIFVPPVEDVYGYAGDPHVKVYVQPSYSCAEYGEGSATSAELASELPPSGSVRLNTSARLNTRRARCDPATTITLASGDMNMLKFLAVDASVFHSEGQAAGGVVQLSGQHFVRSQVIFTDTNDQQWSCPAWKVQVVPFACTSDSAILVGVAIHLILLLALISVQAIIRGYACLIWMKKILRGHSLNLGKASSKVKALRMSSTEVQVGVTPIEPQPRRASLARAFGEAMVNAARDKFGPTDAQLSTMLCSSKVLFLLAICRAGAVVVHLFFLYSLSAGDGTEKRNVKQHELVVPLICISFSFSVQFVLALLGGGLKDLKLALKPRPFLLSAAALLKMHIDTALPLVARWHHCEVWRVAAMFVFVTLATQVAWPVLNLLNALRSRRRRVPGYALRHAVQCEVPLPEPRLEEELGPQTPAKLVGPGPVDSLRQTAISETPGARTSTYPLPPSMTRQSIHDRRGSVDRTPRRGSRQLGVPPGLRALSNLADALEPETSPAPSNPPTPSRTRTSMTRLDLSLIQPKEPPKPCCWRLRRWMGAMNRSARHQCTSTTEAAARSVSYARWQAAVYLAPRTWATPEEQKRQKLAAAHAFFEACGWHAASAAACRTVRSIVGKDAKRLELRWAFLRLASGGLDLTALEAAFLISYWKRLSYLEASVLGFAIAVGVLQTGQMGLVTSLLEFMQQLCHTRSGIIAATITIAVVRALFFLPLAGGCPVFTWQALLWAASLVIVWVPAIALWEWRRRRRREAELQSKLKDAADDADSPLLTPSPKSEPSEPATPAGVSQKGEDSEEFPPRVAKGKTGTPLSGLRGWKTFTGTPGSASRPRRSRGNSRGNSRESVRNLKMMRVLSPEQIQEAERSAQEAANRRMTRKSTVAAGRELFGKLTVMGSTQASRAVTAFKTAKDGMPISRGDAEPLPAAVERLLIHLNECLANAKIVVDPESPQGMKNTVDKVREEAYREAFVMARILTVLLEDLTLKRNLRNRLQHFVGASEIIRDINHTLFGGSQLPPQTASAESGPGTADSEGSPDLEVVTIRNLMSELSYIAEDEYRHAALAVDAVRIAQSSHFRLGTMKERVELMEAALPHLPGLFLVHWRTLASLERLPAYTEKVYLTPARDAYTSSGHNFVAIAVIHSWKTEGEPDPSHQTAKQLISFAQWYRQQWGPDLEPYFWVDFSCLPMISDYNPERSEWKVPESTAMSRRRAARMKTVVSNDSFDSEDLPDQKPEPQSMDSRFAHLASMLGDNDSEKDESEVSEWDESAVDAMLPLVFASSDVVVVCERADSTKRAWVNAEMGLAHAFASGGCTPYIIDRHVGRSKPKKKPSGLDGPLFLDGAELLIMDNPGVFNQWTTPDSRQSNRNNYNQMDGIKEMEDEDDMIRQSSTSDGQFNRQTSPAEIAFQKQMSQVWNAASPIRGTSPGMSGGFPRSGTFFGLEDEDKPESEDETDKPLVVHMGEWLISDPLDIEHAIVDNHMRDRARIVRIVSMSTCAPASSLSGDFHRCFLKFGTTTLAVRHLQHPTKPQLERQKALSKFSNSSGPLPLEDETPRPQSPSDSGSKDSWKLSDPNANSGLPIINKKAVHFSRNKKSMMAWENDKLQLYYAASRPENFVAPHAGPRPADRASTPIENDIEERCFGGQPALMNEASGTRSDGFHSTLRTNAWMRGDNLPALPPLRAGKTDGVPSQAGSTAGWVKSPTGAFTFSGSISATTKTVAPAAPPLDGPRPRRFHADFCSRTVTLRGDGRIIEQLHAWAASGPPRATAKLGAQISPSGGLALTEKPLEVHTGVAGEKPDVRGVAFEATVRTTDTRWDDGIGIGFTAQDPAQWAPRRPKPIHSSAMMRTWVGGFSGRWYFEKRSEFMRSISPMQKAWAPGLLKPGDVVTVVAAEAPVSALRIFVNRELVAEESFEKAGFPEPTTTPLWGVVDIDGACTRALLGKASKDDNMVEDSVDLYGRKPVLLQQRAERKPKALAPVLGGAGRLR